ncbi:MAG: SCO family protein [Limisphaerales bacterium]
MALLCTLGLLGCGPKTNQTAPPTPATNEAKVNPQPGKKNPEIYHVRGVVKRLLLEKGKVTVDHEEIPGFMPAMLMDLNVGDTNDFIDITTNDRIHFRLVVEEKQSWIDEIKNLGQAQSLTNQARMTFRPVREVDPLNVGDLLPDYPFTNTLGKVFNTKDFRGTALAFTFIFTRCPLPDYCPRMNMNFRDAHELLVKDSAGPKNWHLLSLSFDPEHDTPEHLNKYSQAYGAKPDRWTFATGAMIEIDDITERFGLDFYREANGVTFNHKLRTVVINPKGRVHKIFVGNTWKPEELAEAIKKAALVK